MSYSPVAIVWPCSLSVEMYLAAGRSVAVARVSCRSCRVPLGFWSGYWRSVRSGGRYWRMWVARGRCSLCKVSHALIPSFLLVGRHDVVDTIGSVLEAVAGGSGVRPAAGRVDVPYSTARSWVRRFRERSGLVWSGFVAVSVELGGVVPPRVPVEPVPAAFAAIGWAYRAARARHGVLTPPLWSFVSLVCGWALIGTNTTMLWQVFGGRRFIPPVPFTGP